MHAVFIKLFKFLVKQSTKKNDFTRENCVLFSNLIRLLSKHIAQLIGESFEQRSIYFNYAHKMML